MVTSKCFSNILALLDERFKNFSHAVSLTEGQSTVLLQFCAISHIEKSRFSILTTGYISNLKDLGFINVKQEMMTAKTSRIYSTEVKRVLR